MNQEPSDASESWLDLSAFDNSEYDPGRGAVVRTLWYFCSLVFLEGGWLPLSGVKVWLLRLFGAKIGCGVKVKPQVRVKQPWHLEVGDHVWIGQEAWIDNHVLVKIGSHVCVSQKVYFCTGSHDHRRRTFDLVTGSITVGDGAWVGAGAMLFQNVAVGSNALVAGGSVVVKDVAPGAIVGGNPARMIGQRERPAE